MSSFFNLTLDTTPPVLTIYAPNYVSPTETTTITIGSNETLLQFQSIYIIDSLSVRTDLTFSYQTNQYVGTINFSTLSSGFATLYATLKDDVLNQSTISKTINVTDVTELHLTLTEFINHLSVTDSQVYKGSISESTNIVTSSIAESNNLILQESTNLLFVLTFPTNTLLLTEYIDKNSLTETQLNTPTTIENTSNVNLSNTQLNSLTQKESTIAPKLSEVENN